MANISTSSKLVVNMKQTNQQFVRRGGINIFEIFQSKEIFENSYIAQPALFVALNSFVKFTPTLMQLLFSIQILLFVVLIIIQS